MAIGKDGNLSLSKDPKLMIAQKQPWLFPVDVNTARYEELLRVPGIGPVSAKRIIETREDHTITSVSQLKKMKVLVQWALPFMWFKSMLQEEKQARFVFDSEEIADAMPSFSTNDVLKPIASQIAR